MLSLGLVREVERLLAEKQLSQRKIAILLGVSRGAVGAIAAGRRGIWGKESATGEQADVADLLPDRCRSCGFLVLMPCVVCQARDYRRQKRGAGQSGQRGYPGQHGRFSHDLNRTAPAVNVA